MLKSIIILVLYIFASLFIAARAGLRSCGATFWRRSVYIVRDREDGQGLISGSNYQAYGAHGERGVRAYNGGLGAPPPAGSRGRALGRGRTP